MSEINKSGPWRMPCLCMGPTYYDPNKIVLEPVKKGEGFRVRCINCGSSTNLLQSPYKAVKSWNKMYLDVKYYYDPILYNMITGVTSKWNREYFDNVDGAMKNEETIERLPDFDYLS